MTGRKIAGRVAALAVTTALAVPALAGVADAQVGAGWIGPGETNSYWGVKCTQIAIDLSGAASVSVDGLYGPETESGIIAFQQSMGLPDDGVVGPQTGKDLMAFLWHDHPGCYRSLPTPT